VVHFKLIGKVYCSLKRFLILYGICSFLFLSCSNQGQVETKAYSFFVAGHTYGKAGVNNVGFHPPFKNKLERIRNHDLMSFGVLTGDIVHEPTAQDWQEVDDDINVLRKPIIVLFKKMISILSLIRILIAGISQEISYYF